MGEANDSMPSPSAASDKMRIDFKVQTLVKSLAAVCAALFLSSVLFSHNVALRMLLLVLGVACAAFAAARAWRSMRILPPVWLPFLLWAAWSALSLIWSIEPARSEKELTNEVGYAALALLMCHVAAQAPRAPRIMLPLFGAAVVLLCAVALHAYREGQEFFVEGWHGGTSNLSSALLMLMPCAVAAGWYGHRTGSRALRTASAGLAVLMLFAAYTTLNRTLWIGLGIEAALFGALLALRARSARVRIASVVLAAGAVAGSAVLSWHVNDLRGFATPGLALASEPRVTLWPKVVEAIEERPLTGYGFGRGLLRQSLTEYYGSGLIWHAHNLFLDTALQTGLPGLALFLVLLAAIVRQGWRAFRGADDGRAACGLALLGLVTGMAVLNMSNTILVRQNALLFWGVIGVLLAWGGLAARSRAGTA